MDSKKNLRGLAAWREIIFQLAECIDSIKKKGE
jgi:hypothetical protein